VVWSQNHNKQTVVVLGPKPQQQMFWLGTHMVVAQPKRPHGKPASWMMRHDAPALLTLEEFKALSLPALQRLWGEYYVWMGAGERADGSKSGNRSYLQRKLVAA
jgi:hypothetical protein